MIRTALSLALLLSPPVLAAEALPNAQIEKAAIRQLIHDMAAAWNRGDFRGYMAGFKNPDVIFASEGRIHGGWQAVLDRYVKRYGTTPETRGALSFHDIRIEMLAPDAAQLISRYRLDRPVKPMEGINTRLMRKVDGRWVVALNHVSAYELAPGK